MITLAIFVCSEANVARGWGWLAQAGEHGHNHDHDDVFEFDGDRHHHSRKEKKDHRKDDSSEDKSGSASAQQISHGSEETKSEENAATAPKIGFSIIGQGQSIQAAIALQSQGSNRSSM